MLSLNVLFRSTILDRGVLRRSRDAPTTSRDSQFTLGRRQQSAQQLVTQRGSLLGAGTIEELTETRVDVGGEGGR